MKPIIDHIQLTVKDMDISIPYYDRFLPILGFDIKRKASAVFKELDFYVSKYTHPRLAFAITSPRKAIADESIHRSKPGALHHPAFKAESRAEVDSLYQELEEIGSEIVNEPKLYPEYSPDYYALFFKDLEGNKCEIVYTEYENEVKAITNKSMLSN
jgi:predicted lactoylglutathione lyase